LPNIDRWLIALTWMVAVDIVLMLLTDGLLLRIAITVDSL
jgi:hypothetical protein